MPDMNDFHAFNSTKGGSGGGGGCCLGCISPWVITVSIILIIIYLIGKLG